MKFLKKSGIYCIVNCVNDKIYVGSSKNIKIRIANHKNLLIKKKHGNIHLQRAYNKYKLGSFSFEVLEYCNINKLLGREEYWINFYKSNSNKHGYNMESFKNGRKKRVISKAWRRKATLARIRRFVNIYDLNYNIIKSNISVRDASKFVKRKPRTIYLAIKNRHLCNNYIIAEPDFEFLEFYNRPIHFNGMLI